MSSAAVCEKLWREACLYRDGLRCKICGTLESPHVHHIVYRSQAHPSIRWDVDNGIVLCGAPRPGNCHDWAHKNRGWLVDRLPGRLDSRRFEAVAALLEASMEVIRERPDYKAMAEVLRKHLAEAHSIYEMELDMDIVPGQRNWMSSCPPKGE